MKRFYIRNKFIYRMENEDYQSVFLDSLESVVSKRIIELAIGKIVDDCNEQRLRPFIVKLIGAYKKNMELFIKTDVNALYRLILNVRISEVTFQPFYDFFKLFKLDYRRDLVHKHKDFLSQNIYNYFILKNVTNNFEFDILLGENTVDGSTFNLFEDIYIKIIEAAQNKENIKTYLNKYETRKFTTNLIKRIEVYDNHTTKINYQDLGCFLNSTEKICKVCNKYVDLPLRCQYDENDVITEISNEVSCSIVKRDFATLYFYSSHYKIINNISLLEDTVKLIFTENINDSNIFKTFHFFNFQENQAMETIIDELFCFVSNNENIRHYENCINILLNINLTNKLALGSFKVLYFMLGIKSNQFTKSVINFVFKKHFKIYRNNLKKQIEALILHKKEDVNACFERLAVIFDMDYADFMDKYLYEISNVLFNANMFNFIDPDSLDNALVYVGIENIIEEMNDSFGFYGYSPQDFLHKFACKLYPLLLLKKFDLLNTTNPLFDDHKKHFMNNFVGILFNLRSYHRNEIFVDMPCIFNVFITIFKILDKKIMLFFNHLLPFIEYFSSEHEMRLKSDPNSCNKDCIENCLQELYLIIKQCDNQDRISTVIPYFEVGCIIEVDDSSLIFDKLINLIRVNNKSLERIKGIVFDDVFWKFIISKRCFYLERYFRREQKVSGKINKRKMIITDNLPEDVIKPHFFETKNLELQKILTFYLLCKYNVENFNNYFNEFYALIVERFINNHKLYPLFGSIGAIKNIAKNMRRMKYIYIHDFSTTRVAIHLIEKFLIDFNYEMQDIYFFVIQETLKYVEDKSCIQKTTYQFIKHFEDTKYHFDFEFKPKKGALFKKNLRYKDFLVHFLSRSLVILRENNFEYEFNLLKYGILFHPTIIEFYSLSAAKLISSLVKKEIEEIETRFLPHLFHTIDSKIIKFVVKLNIFCNEQIISDQLLINLCIHCKNYYYLLHLFEAKYKTNKEYHLSLQCLYYLISDYDNCSAMNKMGEIITSRNIFFDLCFDRDFNNARKCYESIICNEIEKLLLEHIIQKDRNKRECFENFTDIDFDNFDKILSTWDNDFDLQLKINILHLQFDYQLLLKHPLEESLEVIDYRRNLVVDKEFFIGQHLKMYEFYEKMMVFGEGEGNKAIIQKHKIKLELDRLKIYRRDKFFKKCKIAITEMVLKGNWAALYEDAKCKIMKGNIEDAVSNLTKLLLMVDPCDSVYKKTLHVLARLKSDNEFYLETIKKLPNSEKLYFGYARFLESVDQVAAIENYLKSYLNGVKYSNYIIPRIIHLMCEISDDLMVSKKIDNADVYYHKVYNLILNYHTQIDYTDWPPYFNQIISKITHKNQNITALITLFLSKIMTLYPEKVLWHCIYHFTSKQADIQKAMNELKQGLSTSIKARMINYLKLANVFLSICTFDAKKRSELSLQKDFKADLKFADNVVIPNSNLNCKLVGFEDKIIIFSSLQSPKRVTLLGEDGKKYHILCKPNDDLRKDIRFMDLNRTLNDVFLNHRLYQKQNLYIRTYSVFALNSNNGIIEWINGLESLRSIIDHEYQKKGISVTEEQRRHKAKRKIGTDKFSQILTKFPPVLSLWFEKFHDPCEYYKSRQRFIRTYAVMNIVGWFMGLGDRHLENIMIDTNTADTFHVDLNCLFDSAKRFEVPEKVPFRLTQNIVDAFGPLHTSGTYRKTAEVCLRILIEKKDLIITNLLSFVYDPVDNKTKKNQTEVAKKLVESLVSKLDIKDVGKHVQNLIDEATNEYNLANMYIGWSSFI